VALPRQADGFARGADRGYTIQSRDRRARRHPRDARPGRDESGQALGDEELQNDLITLIGAGHETTASTIAWGTELLAHNPAALERARAAALESDEEYLGAVVKEILRMRPAVPVTAGRILRDELTIGPHTIPAGTAIFFDGWGIQHDPAIYPGPERFDPARFIGREPEPYTWLPFGGGAHRCIGAALAELETKIALRTILRKATIGPADGRLAPMARRGITIVPWGGSRIVVTPAG
jgi:cytochrome P450